MKTFDQCYREILMKTFTFTIEFLEINNLRWYVGGGTMIGTIRHKGLIPWDDDIDISMPREDFEKLLKLRDDLASTEYEIRYLDEDGSYYMPFAKLCHKHSTLWEFECFPCIFGVYVDIFPMDLVEGDRESIQKTIPVYQSYLNRLRRSMVSYSLRDIRSVLKEGDIRKALGIIRDKFLVPLNAKRVAKEYRLFELTLSQTQGDYYVCYGGAYGTKEIYKKEWYEPAICMPFENLTVKVPCGYDSILTQNYGDYMTPPPIEKCIASHDDRYYCNLKERISIDEAKKRIIKGINKEY